MTHSDIFKRYQALCRVSVNDVHIWYPNGKGSIRVTYKDRQEYVFMYINDKNWCLETIDLYIKNLRRNLR
jgi:hypothetical protein